MEDLAPSGTAITRRSGEEERGVTPPNDRDEYTVDLLARLIHDDDQTSPTVPIGACRNCLRTLALRPMVVVNGADRFMRHFCVGCDDDTKVEGLVSPRRAKLAHIPINAVIGALALGTLVRGAGLIHLAASHLLTAGVF